MVRINEKIYKFLEKLTDATSLNSRVFQATQSSVMSSFNAFSEKFEDAIEKFAVPLKPYLPFLGRFFLVVTFFEDAARIIFQWNDQISFMTYYQNFPYWASVFFLGINVFLMIICGFLGMIKKKAEYAVGGLSVVVIGQAIGYGMITDVSFMLRNISLLGGLALLLSESVSEKDKKSLNSFPGLPDLHRKIGTSTYLILLGRVLIVFLFLSVALGGEVSDISWVRLLFSLLSLCVCLLVVIGFKAKLSAIVLLALLSLFNVIVNNFWTLHADHPHRDFMKYDFFQTLSVMGGLLMLVSIGPGGISVDEKKKQY